MLTDFFNNVYSLAASLTLEVSLYICWGAFAFVFLCTLLLTIFNRGVRAADKRPYFALVNAFAAVTFALALTRGELSFSVLLAVTFWCFGYLTYGLIALISRRKRREERYVLPEVPRPPRGLRRPIAPQSRTCAPSTRSRSLKSCLQKTSAAATGRRPSA